MSLAREGSSRGPSPLFDISTITTVYAPNAKILSNTFTMAGVVVRIRVVPRSGRGGSHLGMDLVLANAPSDGRPLGRAFREMCFHLLCFQMMER